MLEPKALDATTTIEEDKHSKSQRTINAIWEVTQAIIALGITAAEIFVSIKQIDSPTITNAFFLIVGFYFGRTNHQKVGGVQLGR